MRRLARRLSTLCSAISLVLAGCATSRFIVVDAETGVPLAGVAVIKQREDWPPPFGDRPPKRMGTTTPDGKYHVSGKHSLMFETPGYRTAEVYFPSRHAWVISPADENAWRFTEDHERHLGGVVPTRNFEWADPKQLIRVRMYRATRPPRQPRPVPGVRRGGGFRGFPGLTRATGHRYVAADVAQWGGGCSAVRR